MPNPFFDTPRTRRLKKDFEEMQALREQSSIIDFDAQGPAPDKYQITFHGNGLGASGRVETVHRLVVNLGMDYPRTQPDTHWQTPIFHPNISGGRPCFGTFAMNPNVRLVDIVEILWDMCRMALYNPYGGYGEKDQWQVLRRKFDFPVDKRILRDKVAPVAPPPVREEDDEPDLIIMSGQRAGLRMDSDWAKMAVEQYMAQAGFADHALIYTAYDWKMHGDGSGDGSLATMIVDRLLFEKLRSNDDEAQAFLEDFTAFLQKLGLRWEDGTPGKIHFYAAKAKRQRIHG